MTIGVGVIGAGRIAQSAHLPAIAKCPHVRLVAVYDPSQELCTGVAQRHQTTPAASLEQLLADPSIEAVVVAVPDRLHLPIASAALRAGKHVLVEKPLASTVEECLELQARADEAGIVLQVGAMKRHDPGVRYAAEAVRERIGRVLSARIWYRVMSSLRSAVEATYFPPMIVDEQVRASEAAFKADRASYLLATHGAHVLDGLRFLLGEPIEVCARRASIAGDHSWHGIACLADGGLAGFEITASVHGEWSEGAEICGERGTVRLRTHFPVTLRPSDVEVFDEATSRIERPVFADSNPYRLQLDAFARSIRDGAPVEPDAADGLAVMRLLRAVGRSVDSGGAWVTT
ncbi:MAG: Gfo/Idh/MocA family oxidoreductase [Actinomycetales bacterium]|nr:Gfo/Idh/MocA family oxidoreductase [Actinomycetales bacterium]